MGELLVELAVVIQYTMPLLDSRLSAKRTRNMLEFTRVLAFRLEVYSTIELLLIIALVRFRAWVCCSSRIDGETEEVLDSGFIMLSPWA